MYQFENEQIVRAECGIQDLITSINGMMEMSTGLLNEGESLYLRAIMSEVRDSLTNRQRLELLAFLIAVESRHQEELAIAETVFETQSSQTNEAEIMGRVTSEMVVTERTELGGFDDLLGKTEESVGKLAYELSNSVINLEQFELSNVLEREYPIQTTGQWLTSESTGTLLDSFVFPADLWDQPFVKQKLTNFRYFKSKLRLSFRVVANQFLYGKLIAYYQPWVGSFNDAFNNVYKASGMPHVLIDAASGDTVTMDIPFIHNQRFLDMTDDAAFVEQQMGRVNLLVMVPLRSTDATTAQAQVLVTAQFVEPELYWPTQFEMQSKSTSVSIAPAKKPVGVRDASVTKNFHSNTSQSVCVTVNPFAEMNYANETTHIAYSSFSDNNCVSNDVISGGMGKDEMSLTDIMCTPQCTWITEIAMSELGQIKVLEQPYALSSCYVDLVRSWFKYFSGSMKYSVKIVASNFHKIKLAFWIRDTATATRWQDCYHQILEVTGSCQFDFSFPYCLPGVMSENKNSIQYPQICITPLFWSQPDTTVQAPITVLLYKAGDTDFHLSLPKDIRFQHVVEEGAVEFETQSDPRADFSKSFPMFHPSMKNYQHENIVGGENYTHLNQLMQRKIPTYRSTNTESITNLLWLVKNPTYNISLGVEAFARLFFFWRGNIRMGAYNKWNVMEAMNVSQYTGGEIYSMGTMCNPTHPILELEYGFHFPDLFNYTTKDYDPSFQISNTSGGTKDFWQYKGAGTNFQFLFLHPPVDGTFAVNDDSDPNSNFYGYAGWRNYCNT